MKKLWLLLPALILAAGLVFMGCDEPKDDKPVVPEGDATWTVTQNGTGVPDLLGGPDQGLLSTTKITITFNKDVILTAQNVDIEGPLTRDTGGFSGSGKVFEIAVTATGSGTASVRITRTGIEAGPKTIEIWKAGEAKVNSFTVTADGEANVTSSTKLTIVLDAAITGLDADENITITYPAAGAGEITTGELTTEDNGITYVLAITVNTAGNIRVALKDVPNFDTNYKTVAVYKATVTEATHTFTEIEVDLDCSHSGNVHRGTIGIEEFLKIKYSKPDSFLRITFKLGAGVNGSWGSGKFGEFGGVDFMVPTSTGTAATMDVDITVAEILESVGASAGSIFVNIWNADPTVEIVVQLVETIAGTRPANPGYSTVSFDLAGGTYQTLTTIAPMDVENGLALGTRFPGSPLKGGFVFTGWLTDAEPPTAFTSTTVVTADVTLTAQYEEGEPEQFTVTFDLDGGTPAVGTAIGPISVVDGQTLDNQFPRTPVRKEGSWFTRWEDSEGDVFTSSTPVTADITVTAKYTPNTQPAINLDTPVLAGYVQGVRIYNDWGQVERSDGKGWIAGADLATLKEAAPDSVLALYIYNKGPTNPSSWGGVGSLETAGKDEDATRINFASGTVVQGQTKIIAAETIEDILTWLDNGTYININIWGDTIVQKIEIWDVDPDFVVPTTHDFVVTLTPNGSYGHQGMITDTWLFNGGKIEQGDVYIATFDAVISTAVSYVNLVLVDNGPNTVVGEQTTWGWKVISGYHGTSAIGTETPSHHSVEITASETATDENVNSNKLVFQTGTETNSVEGNITLTITNFAFVKQE